MIDADAVARFRADLDRVLPEGLRHGEPLAVAVSGGTDSTALLALAQAALPGRVIAATVDHRLRADAAAEAAVVARGCAALGVPHVALAPDEPPAPTQAAARTVRYDLLGRWAVQAGARVLATAHHADDQAETFLMRAARASGVGGLAGVRARREDEVSFPMPLPPDAGGVVYMAEVFSLAVVRPLLAWRRAELAAVAAASGLPLVDDPSNRDPRFDRTHARTLLAATPWLDAGAIAASAAWCAEADATLAAVGDWLWHERRRVPEAVADPDFQTWLDMRELPRALCRRMAREAIAGVRSVNGLTRPAFDRHAANIEPLLDALEQGRAATHAGVVVTPRGGVWRFAEAPPRRDG